MNMRPLIGFALGVLASLPLWAERETEIDVVVDMTPAGHKVAHPDAEHPAYYLPAMTGFRDPGTGNQSDRHRPAPDAVAHQVALALSRQGYLIAHPGVRLNAARQVIYADGTIVRVPANPRPARPIVLNREGDPPLTSAMLESADGPYSLHSHGAGDAAKNRSPFDQVLQTVDPVHGSVLQGTPTLVITIQWGNLDAVPDDLDITYDPHRSMAIAQPMDRRLVQAVALISGDTFPKNMVIDNPVEHAEQAAIIQRARTDRYYLVIRAYDFSSCLPGRTKVLLWRANMSVPSNQNVNYASMLPLMLSAGEGHFGRESTAADYSTVAIPSRGQVTIGTPTVKP